MYRKGTVRQLACMAANIVLGVFCFLLLLLAVPKLIGFESYTVISGSMEPALPVGSVVYVKKVPFSHISKGDVITYLVGENGMRVTHRVVGTDKEKQEFITKGDANGGSDGKAVKFQNVCGVVKFCLPLLGYLQKALADSRGKMAAVSVLSGLLLLSGLLEKNKKGFMDNEE